MNIDKNFESVSKILKRGLMIFSSNLSEKYSVVSSLIMHLVNTTHINSLYFEVLVVFSKLQIYYLSFAYQEKQQNNM